jgi:hypothetical protein
MHDKAAKALVQVAQDPAFADYFKTPHNHLAAKSRIDRISLAAQSKFHVEEMCLIDGTGSEISRIIGNQIAYDLSTEEAENAFLRPASSRSRAVSISLPAYISPDAHKWVLAYTTPIGVDGKNEAILHYEHGLDVYQTALNKEPVPAGTYIVAVDDHGFILSDSRNPIPVAQQGDQTDPTVYFRSFSLSGIALNEVVTLLGKEMSGELARDAAHYTVAYRRVANWTILGVQHE